MCHNADLDLYVHVPHELDLYIPSVATLQSILKVMMKQAT